MSFLVVFLKGKIYKYVSTCTYMNDRKHMKKLREKRIKSVQKQIDKHTELIEKEKGRFDTTKEYWKKEIDEKFLRQIKKDKDYLEDNNGNSDKKIY